MAEVIRMPRLSDTMEEGTLISWERSVGDEVEMGEVIAEIETDKATMEFESPEDGTLLYIGIEEGKSVPVNEIIAVLGAEGEDYEKILEKEKSSEPEPSNGQEKKEEKEESPSKEPSQKSPETPSPDPAAGPAPQPQPAGATATRAATTPDGRIKASPLAKRLAQDKGIDIGQVKGTGDGGRVVKRDIEAFEEEGIAAPSAPMAQDREGYEDIQLSQMRKTIAKRLSQSKYTAPHYYLTISVNMDNAIKARESINETAEEGVKISFNDIIIKAAAKALRQHPQVNATWNEESIRYFKHIHIGMAVAIDEGLIVPVLRFADTKSLTQLSKEARQYIEKAQNRDLELEELQGNTFSISNLGMFDIEEFTAIINPPDSCIMAVGTIDEKPVAQDGELTTAHMMKVTLSCDHRVVDGATGARFLQTFKQFLEDPVRML